ncbi:Separase, partial [Psidium guajava]
MTKGSLATLYRKYNLEDSQVSLYTRQILNGLKYLHDQDVVHRDIKCANILVDASGAVKLADFGLGKATKMNDAKSVEGTPLWMAPEVVKNESYGSAADIWSLGCTVLEMLTRQPPYSHLEGMQALFRIGRGEPPPVPDSLSREAQDLILRCLQVNPNDRPSAGQLLDHPFVRKPSTSSVLEPVHRGRITSWQKGELLGSGSFGTVYKGFTDDGFFFAIKEVSLLDQGSQGKQSLLQLEQEMSLLSQLEHKNIVRYLGTDK